MPKLFLVTLTDQQRQELSLSLRAGQAPARQLLRARILLKADCAPGAPAWSDSQISRALDVATQTVERVRKQFATEGLQRALTRKRPDRIYTKAVDGRAEATLIATACSEPPPGHTRWTLRLLADKLVELQMCESVSHESVRQVMKKK